jgi:hypothetical protein
MTPEREKEIRDQLEYPLAYVAELLAEIDELREDVIAEHQAAVDMFGRFDELRDVLEVIKNETSVDYNSLTQANETIAYVQKTARKAIEASLDKEDK